MGKSKSNKIHLEPRKPEMVNSSPIRRKRKVSNNLNYSKRKVERRKASDSRRKVLNSRRKGSAARRKGSEYRRRTSDSKRRPSGQSVARNFGKQPLLNEAAIMKHIHPSCNTDEEAIHISTERDKKSETGVNHVFKIHPNQFIEAEVKVKVGDKVEDDDIMEMVYISKFPCQYWECKKIQSGKFEVTERGKMHAVFRKSDCHLLIDICHETRQLAS